MKKILFIIALILILPVVSKAQSANENPAIDLSGTPWANDKLPPGTQISNEKDRNGREIKKLTFPGEVSMWQTPSGMIQAVDNSGKGAVYCVWQFYNQLKNIMDKCHLPESIHQNNEEAYFWFSLVSPSSPDYKSAISLKKQTESKIAPEKVLLLNDRVKKWKPSILSTSNIIDPDKDKVEKRFPNLAKSLTLQQKAESGDSEAQLEIGQQYADGFQVREDKIEALKWFSKSALQGNSRAQFKLGKLYSIESDGGLSNKDFLPVLNDAINKINDFIVANSLEPITKKELEEKAKNQPMPYGCIGSEDASLMINGIKETFIKKGNLVDDILSIPRPPVSEPCL